MSCAPAPLWLSFGGELDVIVRKERGARADFERVDPEDPFDEGGFTSACLFNRVLSRGDSKESEHNVPFPIQGSGI